MPVTGPRVAVAVGDGHELDWLRDALGESFDVSWMSHSSTVLQGVDEGTIEVLIVGDRLVDMSGTRLLEQLYERVGDAGPGRVVCLRAANAAEQPATDRNENVDELVFYVLNSELSAEDVRALVQSAVARRRATVSGPILRSADEAERFQRVLGAARRLGMERRLGDAERVAVESTARLIDADRAYCLFHDAQTGALWSEEASEGGEDGTAAVGLTGFAARTGTAVFVVSVGKDPRYVRAVDDPDGADDDQLLAQPVVDTLGQVQAVLVAVRRADQAAFSVDDKSTLATFAERVGPLIQQLALQIDVDSYLDAQDDGWGLPGDGSPFRREAVEAATGGDIEGDVVRVSPGWVSATYWVMLGLLAVSLAYVAVGSINQYSVGPAVVQMGGRSELTARAPGTLVALDVVPGQRVERDQILARFYNVDELSAYEQVQREWEAQLRNYLLDRADPATSAAVGQVRARMQAARSRLEERTVRAPRNGIVSDLRARPGQHLMAGNTILSLVDDATDLTVVAVLPGGDRPQLLPGMRLRLELAGYRYAYQDLEIESVADQVIGPEEARRYFGAQIGDTIPIRGPVVLVTARLPATTFEADGDSYHYYDGMPGIAEVKIRSESVLMTLIPALKRL